VNIRKETLWKVPLFCVVAGISVYILCVYVLLRLAIVNLPDGVITSDNTRVLIIYGALFLGTLLIGGLVFLRDMTRKEIFLSASIVVLYGVILIIIQWAFNLTTGHGAIWTIYLFLPFEWCSVVPQIFFRLNDNLWLGAMVQVLTPYLFVLFGRKSK
jgi:hypothetical protein